jgi:aminopeptidase
MHKGREDAEAHFPAARRSARLARCREQIRLPRMNDPRYDLLARNLVTFSTSLKPGETVLLDMFDIPDEMTVALVRAARSIGARPIVQIHHGRVAREMALGAQEEALEVLSAVQLAQMKKMDAYIAFRGGANITESSDVPADKMKLVSKKMKPVLDWRVKKTKWCVLRWPSPSMAQLAGMSTEAFEDFYFRVCTLDYSRMVPGMKALAELMMKTDQVHIKGPGTDLRFSIKGIKAIPCGGSHNIPDGEVFTAPVRTSVQGHVQYNAPTIYQGTNFDRIRLEFKDGKVVNATCSGDDTKLNDILTSDAGASYIGEFAIGFNPHVLHPMRDILFDEKVAGSFHFTPGQCYEDTENGNRSQVHWDMVCIQRPEYGGGEIYFDGKLIRKDGLFVPKPLQALNPDRLLK